MPKLMLFAPCERVIVEEGSNTVSLISLIQMLTASVPKGVDPKAIALQRWSVLTIWERESSDESKHFEQRIVVRDPNGSTALEALAEFKVTRDFHRNIAMIEGFPLAVPGRYVLVLSLRETGQHDWAVLADYPMTLKHATTPAEPISH